MTELRIDLEDVLSIYREALGSGALLVNGFIRKTVATKDGTAAIDRNGTLYYCPTWFKEHVTSPSKFRDVVMHELMHPVIGDMSRDMGPLPNLAGDIVINSMLYTLGLSPCELQETFYSPRSEPECLLRPNSKPPAKLLGIYASVYPGAFRDTHGIQTCENPLQIMQALQVMYPNEEDLSKVQLLGGHLGQDPSETVDGEKIDPDQFGMPGEIIGDIADICADIAEKIKEANGGGYGDRLSEMVFNIIKSRARFKSKLLKEFETRNVANRLVHYFKSTIVSRSMIPTRVSKSEASKIVMGVPPLYYKRKYTSNNNDKSGIALYLDVSGSVYYELPKIIGLFDCMRDQIQAIYTFSNKVVTITYRDLIEGKIQTTGGTDFNCVINHAVENRHAKILVMTDGDASVTDDTKRLAIRSIPKIGVVYFGNYTTVNWLEEHYGCKFVLNDILEGV